MDQVGLATFLMAARFGGSRCMIYAYGVIASSSGVRSFLSISRTRGHRLTNIWAMLRNGVRTILRPASTHRHMDDRTPRELKVIVENAVESYHVPMVHPNTFQDYRPEELHDHRLKPTYTRYGDLFLHADEKSLESRVGSACTQDY